MSLFKLLPFLFFCFISGTITAQEKKYFVSEPVDLPQIGWNKVLCMKNGNTMLFHFEPQKDITLKVFDSSHKEIASKKTDCKLIDIFIIKNILFKGLYDINGEAVIFLEQEHLSKNQLIRLRFNSKDGSLIEEKLIGESESISKRTRFRIIKNKSEDGYAILFSTDVPDFKTCNLHVTFYDKNHEAIKDVPLETDRGKYDFLELISAESQPNGVCVTISLSNLITNGSTRSGSYGLSVDIYNHYFTVFYIPTGSSKALKKIVDVSTDVFPYNAYYTYNSFAKTLNLLLLSYKEVMYKYGIEWRPAARISNLFFKLDENNLDLTNNWIPYKMANDYLQQKTDTNHAFDGLPLKVYTNENGLSTIISSSYNRLSIPETRNKINHNTYLGNIGITQFDDDGKEIWGTVLPFSQYFMSYHHYYLPNQLFMKWQEQIVFGDLPEQVYERQFFSLNTYNHDKNIYIVYNDINKNFNNTIEHPGDTVFSYGSTNACYYKMNRKKEITKSYLFGEPAADEYMASFVEGADFDEQRGVYASLVQKNKNGKMTLYMGWSKLD